MKKKNVRKERAYILLEKLTLGEVTEEVFDLIKTKNSFTSVATINVDFTVKLVMRPYLDLLLQFFRNTNLACNMEVVVASLNGKKW